LNGAPRRFERDDPAVVTTGWQHLAPLGPFGEIWGAG